MALPCGCGSGSTCSCVLADGCGTTISGAGTSDNPYVIDGSSNIVLADTVVSADPPPCSDSPAVMHDPDTGILIGYWDPDVGWSAVAGGAGGVEVYAVTEDPNTDIGDPGVAVAVAYDTGTPSGTAPNSSVADSLWMWDDGAGQWERYPKIIHASIAGTSAKTFSSGVSAEFATAPTENYDTASMHSGTNGRLYAPMGGLYEAKSLVAWDDPANNTAAGTRKHNFLVTYAGGGSLIVAGGEYKGAADPVTLRGERDIVLSAGDYVQVRCTQDSGGNCDATLVDFTLRLIQAL